MSVGYHNLETSDFDQPGLAYDPIESIHVPHALDSEIDYLFVPMILTSYVFANKKSQLNPTPIIPLVDTNSGLAYGGVLTFVQTEELPKMQLEGTIDTPCTNINGWELPFITGSNGQYLHYSDIISKCFEGTASSGSRSRIHPRWFRDPYGRIYGDYHNQGLVRRPKVFDFQPNYVAGVPGRVQFQLVLQV